MKRNTTEENMHIAETQFLETKKLIKEISRKMGGKPQKVAIATYSEEDFAEIRKGESFEDFSEQEEFFREFLEMEDLLGFVYFLPVDAVEYFQFLALENIPDNQKARAAFVGFKAQEIAKRRKAEQENA